jgi:hypothetical protein
MADLIGSRVRASLVAFLVGAFAAGCGIATVEQPDPAEIPEGPLEVTGPDATGPIVELGRGRTLGIGWRYAIYPSADGWCTQLELTSFSSSGCGDLLPPEGSAFGSVGSGAPSDGPTPVEGIVRAAVAEVWLVASSGQRIETTLMPLTEAGLEGKAFVGFAPAASTPSSLVAIDDDGQEMETFDLP